MRGLALCVNPAALVTACTDGRQWTGAEGKFALKHRHQSEEACCNGYRQGCRSVNSIRGLEWPQCSPAPYQRSHIADEDLKRAQATLVTDLELLKEKAFVPLMFGLNSLPSKNRLLASVRASRPQRKLLFEGLPIPCNGSPGNDFPV